ncbi:MAG: DUF4868 domain-containing protein [Lachnospiraceae bacterium]|nr:DUF4868 domain-containing protein [Lachnospiraceae bacterium]
MSIKKLEDVFKTLPKCDSWSMQLLKIKTTKRDGTSYMGRKIVFSPEDRMKKFIIEISQRYTDGQQAILKSYLNVIDYDGSTMDKTLYKLQTDSELIKSEYDTFLKAIAEPDVEANPLELSFQAYLLKGIVGIEGNEVPIKLISMQNPITKLKHKFMMNDGEFSEIEDKVLSLRPTFDVVIIDDCVYMLTLAAENLFNMERSYKAICSSKIEAICESEIVTDTQAFNAIAGSGHNPRRFVSFNDTYLQKMKNKSSRRKMANQFNITLDGDRFDTSKPEVSEKLVKLLCSKGMINPFDDKPMEVAGSKSWI